MVYHVVDNVIVAKDGEAIFALILTVLFPNHPDIGLLGAVGSVEHDLFLQGIVFDHILDATLMTETRLEFGPCAQDVVLVGSARPLGKQRLIARHVIEEGRRRKIEEDWGFQSWSTPEPLSHTIVRVDEAAVPGDPRRVEVSLFRQIIFGVGHAGGVLRSNPD